MPKKDSKTLYLRPYEEGIRKCPVKVEAIDESKLGIFPLEAVKCEKYLPSSPGKPAQFEQCTFIWDKKPTKEIESWRFDPGQDPGVVTDNPMKWLNFSPHAFEWDCPEKIFVADKRLFSKK